jgi:hypothetical protein
MGPVLAQDQAPTDNPVRSFYEFNHKVPRWTDELPWGVVVSVADYEGSAGERFRQAQRDVLQRGGGVVYFPAGTWRFEDNLVLESGCIIRGAAPTGVTSAKDEGYEPPTRFEFPKYEPTFEGEGTPIDTAFKNIRLGTPSSASNCGVVHVAVNRAHIHLGERHAPDQGLSHVAGHNRLVFGCKLTNTAYIDRSIPYTDFGQHAWQRYIHRHRAAIHVNAEANLLVANNRMPRSGEDNFLMKDYVLLTPLDGNTKAFKPGNREARKVVVEEGVLFDFDNRPCIYANDYGDMGPHGDGVPNGTPDRYPHGFRRGIVIRDNYCFATGRTCISFSGDGTVCADNIIRIPDGIWRPTCKGYETSNASSTNDNRAIRCRGWRWTVSGNDYSVHANRTFNRKHGIGDGEGIMHENHENSIVLGSRVINNKGNAYICFWRVSVDGLLVEGNDIDLVDHNPPITVRGRKRHNPAKVVVRNVRIVNNVTRASRKRDRDWLLTGILVSGDVTEDVVIRGNRHEGPEPGYIVNEADAQLESNEGYLIMDDEAEARKHRPE